MVLALLCFSHLGQGGFDEEALRAARPLDVVLAGLDPLPLVLALRALTAKAVTAPCRHRGSHGTCPVRATAPVEPAHAVSAPSLESFAGDAPSLCAARQMVADLQAWRAGQIG